MTTKETYLRIFKGSATEIQVVNLLLLEKAHLF